MRTQGTAAAQTFVPQIEDPVLRAIMSAPIEDMPETAQEKLDVEEAHALGHFAPAIDVSHSIAARRPR